MLTKLLKNDTHFISSNVSNSCFSFKEKDRLYTIRIRKKFNPYSQDHIVWEYPEENIWETPFWFRVLAKKAEDTHYIKYKEKYKEVNKKISLSMVLFLFSIEEEDADEGFEMDDEFSIYLKGENIVTKNIDFMTWRKDWKSSFTHFEEYLNMYGYQVKVVEENHYERYLEIIEVKEG